MNSAFLTLLFHPPARVILKNSNFTNGRLFLSGLKVHTKATLQCGFTWNCLETGDLDCIHLPAALEGQAPLVGAKRTLCLDCQTPDHIG